eukprot:1219634-Ditylum_brightwellii.AAC.1
MDANKVDEAGSQLRKFRDSHDLVHIFTHMHPDITPPHTYQQSTNRLDYIFVTRALIPAITAV